MSYATSNRPPRHNDYDDQLDSEEEEEERLLSAEHGEASEDSTPKRKRTVNATKFSEADAAAAREFEEKVRAKKPRPTLTPADLKGPKGLVMVRRSFPRQCKFREPPSSKKVIGTGIKSSKIAQKMNQEAQITAAANYARTLMTSYRAFARGLFPSLAPEDVLLKIEDMGSKKEVKDYLQIMRNELRREYLEGIYGKKKTERILHELECGFNKPVETAVDEDYVQVNRRLWHAVLSDEEVQERDVANEGKSSSSLDLANYRGKETNSVPDVTDGAEEEEELEFVNADEPLEEQKDVTIGDNTHKMSNAMNFASKKIIPEDAATENFPTTRRSETPLETKETFVGHVTEYSDIFDNGMTKDTEPSAIDIPALDGSMSKNDPKEDMFVVSEEIAPLTETQETLTLLESQFDLEDEACVADHKDQKKVVEVENRANGEVHYHTKAEFNNTKDERFSPSNVNNNSTFEIGDESQCGSASVQ
ncbi:LOW QUALITY PROTEIN: hypothetical protein ACHAW6_001202 [Cyclotella cf. meneghiniana]